MINGTVYGVSIFSPMDRAQGQHQGWLEAGHTQTGLQGAGHTLHVMMQTYQTVRHQCLTRPSMHCLHQVAAAAAAAVAAAVVVVAVVEKVGVHG